MKNIILPIIASFAITGVLFAEEQTSDKTNNESTLCETGKNQSPINIDSKTSPDAFEPGIKFNYGLIIPQKITHEGGYIRVDVGAGTNIKLNNDEFELKHLDIHVPSEHTINGKSFPLEIQFAHENKQKELAYVSVLFTQGSADRTLDKLLKQMPKNVGESNTLAPNTLRKLEMKKLLANYYQYNGSMTKSPCSEGVRWFIMKPLMTLSEQQKAQFQNVIEQGKNRPVQALNARITYK